MSTLILKSAGSILGGSIAGPLGAAIGSSLGQIAGSNLSPSSKLPRAEGPRLQDLSVQSSTYGKMLPIVFGTMRVAGNVIWSRPIKETAIVTQSSGGGGGGKGGGGRVTQSSTRYDYSVSLAISICEGPVSEILRVWADAKLVDLSTHTIRFYSGTETQLPIVISKHLKA